MDGRRWFALGVWAVVGIVILGAAASFGADPIWSSPKLLTVTANPSLEADITVFPSDNLSRSNGTTDFERAYDYGTSVQLTAAAIAIGDYGDLGFRRWVVYSQPQPDGQQSVSFAMIRDTNAIAVYETATWELVVRSTPFDDVAITGPPAGTTRYTATIADRALITLSAPRYLKRGGRTWCFYHWVLNGVDVINGERTVNLRIRSRNVLTARYRYVRRLTISGPSSLPESSTRRYRCTAYFNVGPAGNVTGAARWLERATFLGFRARGVLRAFSVSRDSASAINARYGGFSKYKYVEVLNR